jgi:hypothetical protein
MNDLPGNSQPRPNGKRVPRQRQLSRRNQPARKEAIKKQEAPGETQIHAQNRGGRSRPALSQSEEIRKTLPVKTCAVCGKPIFDLLGAIADNETGEPIHFDCALEKVAASESLAPQERIAYLGAGCFGILATSQTPGGEIVVKKIIHWEKEGEKQTWRKDLSINVLKL